MPEAVDAAQSRPSRHARFAGAGFVLEDPEQCVQGDAFAGDT
ncbi:hypothetical protein [Salinarchaeum laminariae]|nr:hypothetical protein [Salinarchaeum laminariae]